MLHWNMPYRKRDEAFTLYHITDIHLGAKACDEKQLDRDIRRIAEDDNARWIGGGDYIDAICQAGDRRYRPSTLAKWLHGIDDVMGGQVDYCINKLAPIAKKCLGLVKGNHEDAAVTWYARDVYYEIVKGISQAAGKPPESFILGTHGFINLSFRRHTGESSGGGWRMVIYTHHGYGGGRMEGGHALTLGRVLKHHDCDLALLGHRHVQQEITFYTAHPTKTGFYTRRRTAAFVPSYLRSFAGEGEQDTYAERAGYPPNGVGCLPIIIDPDARAFHLIVSGGDYGAKRKPSLAGVPLFEE